MLNKSNGQSQPQPNKPLEPKIDTGLRDHAIKSGQPKK